MCNVGGLIRNFKIGEQIKGTHLTPLQLTKIASTGNRAYVCKCTCGRTSTATISGLALGKIKSCGCAILERPQNTRFTDEQVRKAFFDKVNKTNGCWLWTASRNGDGYGMMVFRGRGRGAHRVSWVLHYGEIPDGLRVLHKCDNPPCVNPEHLFLGTQLDNVRDCMAKNRDRKNPRKGASHPNAKLTENDVWEIRRMLSHGLMHKTIAQKFGLRRQSIGDIANGRNWASL